MSGIMHVPTQGLPGGRAQSRLHRSGCLPSRQACRGNRLPGPQRLRRSAHDYRGPPAVRSTTTIDPTTRSGCRTRWNDQRRLRDQAVGSCLPRRRSGRLVRALHGWRGHVTALVAQPGLVDALSLRVDQLIGRRQLAAVSPATARIKTPTDESSGRTVCQRDPGSGGPRPLGVLQSGHRTGDVPARNPRRHLARSRGRGRASRLARRGQRCELLLLPERGTHIRGDFGRPSGGPARSSTRTQVSAAASAVRSPDLIQGNSGIVRSYDVGAAVLRINLRKPT